MGFVLEPQMTADFPSRLCEGAASLFTDEQFRSRNPNALNRLPPNIFLAGQLIGWPQAICGSPLCELMVAETESELARTFSFGWLDNLYYCINTIIQRLNQSWRGFRDE